MNSEMSSQINVTELRGKVMGTRLHKGNLYLILACTLAQYASLPAWFDPISITVDDFDEMVRLAGKLAPEGYTLRWKRHTEGVDSPEDIMGYFADALPEWSIRASIVYTNGDTKQYVLDAAKILDDANKKHELYQYLNIDGKYRYGKWHEIPAYQVLAFVKEQMDKHAAPGREWRLVKTQNDKSLFLYREVHGSYVPFFHWN